MRQKLLPAAAKYFESLDRPTKRRIVEKIAELCSDPYDIRTSKPLVNREERSARVGKYRILFAIVGEAEQDKTLLVLSIRPRGDVYR